MEIFLQRCRLGNPGLRFFIYVVIGGFDYGSNTFK